MIRDLGRKVECNAKYFGLLITTTIIYESVNVDWLYTASPHALKRAYILRSNM
jgi:hypothetical protein